MTSKHSRNLSNLSGPLPAISEDGTDYNFPIPPTCASTPTTYIPGRTTTQTPPQRPSNHTPTSFGGETMRGSHESNGYANEKDARYGGSKFSDTSSLRPAGGDKEEGNERKSKKGSGLFSTRGGWKRLALIVGIVLLCVIGLIVGLVVGLRNRNNNDDTSSTPTTSSNQSSFPSGTYSVTPSLLTISKNCTSNSLTWRCQTNDTLTSSTRFDWVIRPATSSPQTTYTISTTPNPFMLTFTNQTLNLTDANTLNERYTFQYTYTKQVIPLAAVSEGNVASTCYFEGTMLRGSLYTRTMTSVRNATTTTTTTTTGGYAAWPGRVEVEETSTSGAVCRDAAGNVVGSFGGGGGVCECGWGG